MKSKSTHTDTIIKDCRSCAHQRDGLQSIDDAPPICWSCLNAQDAFRFPLPYWKPRDENSKDKR